jgi:hypothetical protein
MYDMDKNEIHLTIDSKQYPNLPDLRLDDTGEVTLTFEIVGLNKYDDEALEGERNSCTLKCKVKSMSVKKVSLQDAGERALKSTIPYVKTQISPAP